MEIETYSEVEQILIPSDFKLEITKISADDKIYDLQNGHYIFKITDAYGNAFTAAYNTDVKCDTKAYYENGNIYINVFDYKLQEGLLYIQLCIRQEDATFPDKFEDTWYAKQHLDLVLSAHTTTKPSETILSTAIAVPKFTVSIPEAGLHFKDGNYEITTGIESREDYHKSLTGLGIDKISKINDFIFEIDYNWLDKNEGLKFMEEKFPINSAAFGCSGVRKGNWFGRNFDLTYNNDAVLVIKTLGMNVKYKSVGISSSHCRISDDEMKNWDFTNDSLIGALRFAPFVIVDGINECGLAASVNVVHYNDTYESGKHVGENTGTNPMGEPLLVNMIIRHILDNYSTATEAVEALKDYNIYNNKNVLPGYDYHLMVCDAEKTYIIEFKDYNGDGVCEYIYHDMDSTSDTWNLQGKTFMTNFILSDAKLKSSGHWDSTNVDTITTHSDGMERYNLIVDNFANCGSFEGMVDLMTDKLRYTKAYESTTSPYWYTEFVGEGVNGENLTTRDAIENQSKYALTVAKEQADYIREHKNGRLVDNETWETSHTSIYDLNEKKLYLFACEEPECHGLSPKQIGQDYTDQEIDDMWNVIEIKID